MGSLPFRAKEEHDNWRMIWLSLRNNLKKSLCTLMKPSPPNRRDWTCDRGDLDFQSQERYTVSISIHHHLKVGYRIPEGDEWREYQIQETPGICL